MSTTVLDALQNARMNFETIGKMGVNHNPIFTVAMAQLNLGDLLYVGYTWEKEIA